MSTHSPLPRIVVLDGFTLNPGDLSWSGLEALGCCEIHDRSEPSQVVPRARGAELVLTNKTPLTRAHLDALPALRYIGVLATGFNIVDTGCALEKGIPVTNVPAYGTQSVAQMTFALILELTQRTGHHAATVRDGQWSRCPDFCYWDFPLVELDGCVLGIAGFGRIGQAVARIGAAFGMKILAHSPRPIADAGVEQVSLNDLFERADVLSLHCPLRPETERFVNADRLARMKPSAFLINTSRGGLIDEAALADALESGRLAGAGLDVLASEPPPAANPLLTARNCIITPHIAWATKAARARLLDTAIANARSFLNGRLVNAVNF